MKALPRRLELAYLAGLHAAIDRYGDDPDEIVAVDADAPFLRRLNELTARRDYWRNGENTFEQLVSSAGLGSTEGPRGIVLGTMRPLLVREFAFAVPNQAVLDALVDLGPVVEIGAGGGYWARCVSERGGSILAFDAHDPTAATSSLRRLHFPVRVADVEQALEQSGDARTLLLCWPPGPPGPAPVTNGQRYLGERALEAFRGDWIVFVGEHSFHFGTPEFFRRLDHAFVMDKEIVIPTLAPWQDAAYVYRRRGGAHPAQRFLCQMRSAPRDLGEGAQ